MNGASRFVAASAVWFFASTGCEWKYGGHEGTGGGIPPWGLTETYVIVDLSTGGVTEASAIADLETNDAYKTTKLVLKRIPAGTFQMGDQVGGHENDELPVHTVSITRPFYMGVFEVTQEQWTTIVGSWTFYFPGNPQRPAEQISWNDIKQSGGFMDTLSSRASMSFRLPTEAEWEYCCKAGTSTNYSFGDTADGAWMWSNSNSESRTHDVATTASKPNPWGLYDMHGNLYEWCEDWYDGGYYSYAPTNDPQGPASITPYGCHRVLRGGSWRHDDNDCRSAVRAYVDPSSRHSRRIGFRVAVAAAGHNRGAPFPVSRPRP